MAPNKFEKHIKEKLDGREIKPSTKAWQKLSNQLDTSVQPKNKGYFWYGIAASFIGILIVSILYMNRDNTQIIPNIQVVGDSPEEENKDANDFNIELLIEDTSEIKVAETNANEIKNESIKDIKQEILVADVEDKIAPFEKETSAIEEIQVKGILPDEIINTKILEVVAQVNLLEEDTNALTDAEVDSLLRNAQREILTDKLFNKDQSIDAMALLTTVEDELDQSFRDQIFETLKTGFLKVRTAVADRNN